MGSATTQALAATTAALDAASGVDLGVAQELFAAARAMGDSKPLSGALADAAAAPAARRQVVATVFGGYRPAVTAVIDAAAAQRWSSAEDLVTGIEELAVRAAAKAESTVDVEGELFGVTRTVAANPELELALGSRLGQPSAKGALIEKLLAGRTSPATSLIVSSLVQQPRGRRVRSLLSWAMRLVADQRGRTVATVYAAAALTDAQQARLQALLAQRTGGEVSINVVIDREVVGGIRVEIGDEVVDASISSRLSDLRQRLAG
ncbi:F0F1 ATP synthase subunit delta [Microbacterium sp.]|uniref:F0F1 ATP synthase subunit delta n=1 Tax=Microbacterium sp. TaxID=51671 RepID=UPI003A87E013